MSEAMNQFMNEGFRRFAEAHDAITLFTDTVRTQLRDMLEQRQWTRFEPVLDKVRTEWKGAPERGLWICALIPGTLAGKALTLDCGFWWNPPKISAHLIAYASFYGNSADLEQLDYTPRDRRIQTRRVGQLVRLYLAEPDRDPTTDINTLINELMEVPWKPVPAGK